MGGEEKRVGNTRKKKGPLRISLGGLTLEGGRTNGTGGDDADGWDPRKHTSRPEEWFKPQPSVVKRRWDDEAKVHEGGRGWRENTQSETVERVLTSRVTHGIAPLPLETSV